jgi:hypothetical protein
MIGLDLDKPMILAPPALPSCRPAWLATLGAHGCVSNVSAPRVQTAFGQPIFLAILC